MTITRHLDDATLMSFAAGSLPAALAVVAAAHLAMCPRCRDGVVVLERVGGVLVAGLAGAAMVHPEPDVPELGGRQPAAASTPAPHEVPRPLARLVGSDLDAVRWRWIAPGLRLRLLPIRGQGSVHLLKGSPGVSVPEHDHGGSELTLVLRGALIDARGRYGPGDVTDVDEEVEQHMAAADPEAGCICVLANEQPTRFRGLLARLLRPWHGM